MKRFFKRFWRRVKYEAAWLFCPQVLESINKGDSYFQTQKVAVALSSGRRPRKHGGS